MTRLACLTGLSIFYFSAEPIAAQSSNTPSLQDTLAKAADANKDEELLALLEFINPFENAWLEMGDEDFATYIAKPLAFDSSNEKSRSLVAWMYFLRATQNAPAGSNHTMEWMTWHTNSETFSKPDPTTTNANITHKVLSKSARALGKKSQIRSENEDCPKNFPPQAVTRNDIAFNYLNKDAKIWSKKKLTEYFEKKNSIDMPVGSIGMKGIFIDPTCVDTVTPPLSQNAVSENVALKSGDPLTALYMTGLHIMAKLQPTPENPFTSLDPSWFWTTFEYVNNPGLDNLHSMISEPDALPPSVVEWFQNAASKTGNEYLKNYTLSGTQVSFLTDSGGISVLGSSKLEDFAGGGINTFPNYKAPEQWTVFNASCHACHSTAAFNPETQTFFVESRQSFNNAFPLVIGELPPSILDILKGAAESDDYENYDYKHLDFLWPITFQFADIGSQENATETETKKGE